MNDYILLMLLRTLYYTMSHDIEEARRITYQAIENLELDINNRHEDN